ncbi:MAG TPA: hypothetical protein VIP98_21065, partial [Microlunatus sp.]
LPKTSPNPYLFISGLTQAADVVVRTVGSNNVNNDITTSYPGVEVVVTRDPTTSGPVILTTVTAASDKDAATVLQLMVDRTSTTVEQLQTQEQIRPKDHITVIPLSIDEKSQLKQRKRLLATGAVGGGILVLTLLLASVVDGLRGSRASSNGPGAGGPGSRGKKRDAKDNEAEADRPEAGSAPIVAADPAAEFEPAAAGTGHSDEPSELHRDAVSAASGGTSWRA